MVQLLKMASHAILRRVGSGNLCVDHKRALRVARELIGDL